MHEFCCVLLSNITPSSSVHFAVQWRYNMTKQLPCTSESRWTTRVRHLLVQNEVAPPHPSPTHTHTHTHMHSDTCGGVLPRETPDKWNSHKWVWANSPNTYYRFHFQGSSGRGTIINWHSVSGSADDVPPLWPHRLSETPLPTLRYQMTKEKSLRRGGMNDRYLEFQRWRQGGRLVSHETRVLESSHPHMLTESYLINQLERRNDFFEWLNNCSPT